MTGAASRSMKKITYVRVNQAIQGKTVTVSTTKVTMTLEKKTLHKVFFTYRMCFHVLYTRQNAFYTLNTLRRVVNLTQRKTSFPLTTDMAGRTRLNS